MEKSEFEKLVMRVRPSMLDLCRGFLNANRLPDAPEDVVQDALLRLWGMKDRLQPESHPEALALRIVKNLCIDSYRRRVLDSVSVESVAPMDSLTPEKKLLAEERLLRLQTSMENLPATQRKMLCMKSEGMSLDEIAAVCATTKNCVKTQISSARKKMLEQIKKYAI
ncbi:MAG: RNA polymerase sigma factor [Bacteroidaceae bacterium]|nr:RNA polymerase sigma factor [Bacteroidaceae bacterium]